MKRWLTLAAALGACNSSHESKQPPAQDWNAKMAVPTAEPASPTTPRKAPHGKIGTDVSKMGLPPPDPARPLDPTHHVRGVIHVPDKLRDRTKPGTALFLVIKRPDAAGNPSGSPLAVRRMTWEKNDMPFELTEAQAMIAGTQLTGEVLVMGHYDQDGDALSRQPGDLIGSVRVTVPAEAVKLELDTVVP